MAEPSGESGSEEKKHEASPRRQDQAREEGQIARAPDFAKFTLMASFFLLALLPGSALVQWIFNWVPSVLGHAGDMSLRQALGLAFDSLGALSLLLLVMGFIGALGALVPGGWNASTKPITPDFNRLNPAQGFKNLFSPKRLTETLKSLLKFGIIGGAGTAAFLLWESRLTALTHTAIPDWVLGLHAVVWILGASVLSAVVIVALDTPLQAWFHRRDLRMTDKEVRDELKETEVNPQVRRRLRQAAAKAAKARMMEQLPKASAVVVNPTHYAVALRYRRNLDTAPVVVAAGVGQLSDRIRKIARRHGIPIVSAPPLARALYYHVPPGEPVPAALYQACAEVLAYVWRVHLSISGQGPAPLPPDGAALAVDARLDPVARRNGTTTGISEKSEK